jgi:hypothetical protein
VWQGDLRPGARWAGGLVRGAARVVGHHRRSPEVGSSEQLSVCAHRRNTPGPHRRRGSASQGTDPWGNTRAGPEVVATLKRSDFDMKFNQALGSGNVLVGDKVAMTLDISAVLQAS